MKVHPKMWRLVWAALGAIGVVALLLLPATVFVPVLLALIIAGVVL